MIQPQSVVFFIDRCLGSRRIPEVLRGAGITVEAHDDHFNKGAQDVDWLPEIGKKGWIVLTKDLYFRLKRTKRLSATELRKVKTKNQTGAGIKQLVAVVSVK